jgi:alkaline phosphatase
MPTLIHLLKTFALFLIIAGIARADHLADLQTLAGKNGQADWGHWGADPSKYSSWKSHTNRLIPVYTFGIKLDAVQGDANPYRNEDSLRRLYGQIPRGTLNPNAPYFDQTGIHTLLMKAGLMKKKYVVLMVFDGMDWQITRAAAIYKAGKVTYDRGRGSGLAFQDYRGAPTDFGLMVTSPAGSGASLNVRLQQYTHEDEIVRGGYDALHGNVAPWFLTIDRQYPIGESRTRPHAVTDSAASATSMNSGIKAFNKAINVDTQGKHVEPIARVFQRGGYAVGVVTSVPISHATPAAAYANNISRDDYQNLSRDLLGLRSISHPKKPLDGVDVLLGAGWGVTVQSDKSQGVGFVPGNRFVSLPDVRAATRKYHAVQRTAGKNGAELLAEAADEAIRRRKRLIGLFGVPSGHLPYRTADGRFDPVPDERNDETYTKADINENPTLADMTRAALRVLETDPKGFWLMVEAGDVDWASHGNNIDNAIGAILSGEEAFKAVTDWAEKNDRWKDTVIILTADHGHYFNLRKPEALLKEEDKAK